jgi:hypothetical protein
MKALFTLLAAVLTLSVGYSQDIEKKLRPFNKIVVSQKINLVLIPGDTESIRITYNGVEADKIIIDQSGRRVHIYLQDAKIIDKGERRGGDMFDRRPRYRFASVTAYVTFKSLRLIETRGEGDVTCEGSIISKKIKVRAYGETDLRFAYLEAATVKARMYGQNTLKIADGNAGHSSYILYGENKIDSRGLKTVTSSTTIYGEGRVSLFATEEVRLNSFGDPSLFVSGSPKISKGIIMGRANIRRN